MKDLLLAWITKPKIEVTLLQEIIGATEILIGIFIVVFIWAVISAYIEVRKEKKENK